MTKRMKIALCTLLAALLATAGIFVLLSGSGNGYETVFASVEKLAFETDNVTIDSRIEVLLDGEIVERDEAVVMKAGEDQYSRSKTGEETSESYRVDNKHYHTIDHEEKTYYFYTDSVTSFPAETNVFIEDTKENRAIYKLFKLFADFVSGNAKNQFVRERLADGNRYNVSLSREQLPEAAGLIIEILNADIVSGYAEDGVSVDFENHDEAFSAYYMKKTGETMDSKVQELYYYNDELDEAYWELRGEMRAEYVALGESVSPNAYVYVDADGNAKVYASRRAMYEEREFNKEAFLDGALMRYVDHLDIDSVKAVFDVDADGRIRKGEAQFDIALQDLKGKIHTLTIRAQAEFSGYGTTNVALPDFSQYSNLSDIKREIVYEETTETVFFLGKEYTVNYEERIEKVIE